MSRAHCIECGFEAVIDPSGSCPDGHRVGTPGERIAGAIASGVHHPDEPEPWVARVVLDEREMFDDEEPGAASDTAARSIRPRGIAVHDDPTTSTNGQSEPDGNGFGGNGRGFMQELHALSADGPPPPGPAAAGDDTANDDGAPDRPPGTSSADDPAPLVPSEPERTEDPPTRPVPTSMASDALRELAALGADLDPSGSKQPPNGRKRPATTPPAGAQPTPAPPTAPPATTGDEPVNPGDLSHLDLLDSLSPDSGSAHTSSGPSSDHLDTPAGQAGDAGPDQRTTAAPAGVPSGSSAPPPPAASPRPPSAPPPAADRDRPSAPPPAAGPDRPSARPPTAPPVGTGGTHADGVDEDDPAAARSKVDVTNFTAHGAPVGGDGRGRRRRFGR